SPGNQPEFSQYLAEQEFPVGCLHLVDVADTDSQCIEVAAEPACPVRQIGLRPVCYGYEQRVLPCQPGNRCLLVNDFPDNRRGLQTDLGRIDGESDGMETALQRAVLLLEGIHFGAVDFLVCRGDGLPVPGSCLPVVLILAMLDKLVKQFDVQLGVAAIGYPCQKEE